MRRRPFLSLLAGGLPASAFLLNRTGRAASVESAAVDFQASLEEIRVKHDLPALGAARFGLDGVRFMAATGVRKRDGSGARVTDKDQWHLGSMTKAMTATLLATYVKEGRLKWEDPLGTLLPEACEGTAAGVSAITVRQLLSHRSGLPANVGWWLVPPDRRGELLRLAVPAAGKGLGGSGKYLYSNTGYAVAGHLAEKLDGQPWETLMETRLFRPLKITAGQGPVGTEGKEDQPWPHETSGKPCATNGLNSDNAPSLGPAGRVHASMENYALFAADHLRGASGDSRALLPAELYRDLQTPAEKQDYALGWVVTTRPWADGPCLTHNGTNTVNFFVAWLAPRRKFGVLAACNQGGDRAAKACDEACSRLIRTFS